MNLITKVVILREVTQEYQGHRASVQFLGFTCFHYLTVIGGNPVAWGAFAKLVENPVGE